MIALLKILILEDNESDADLLQRELKKSGIKFTSQVVQSRSAFEQALVQFVPDLILSDYALPSFDAVSAFRIKQLKHAYIPFIIVSGVIGEENAVELIKDGVTDYVSKQKLFTLSTKINRALADAKARTEKVLVAQKLKAQTAELILANHELVKQEEKVKTINQELSLLNQELEARVLRRTQALAESESRFRNMMEAIPQIAWTNTCDGDVIFYNQRWYDYTGLSHQQTRLFGFHTNIHTADRKTSYAQFSTILKTKVGGEFQIRAKRSDGVYRWHLVRLMPVLDKQGIPELWVGSATDIEELMLLQQHKDDFISIASHELKTPITSLKASLQLLDRIKNRTDSPMLPILVEQAIRGLNKVDYLIEDLLNASMANEGQLHIKHIKINMATLIDQSCSEVRAAGNYQLQRTGQLDLEVEADPIRIEQVLVNFVNNAIKYAPDSKSIQIDIQKTATTVKVCVIDKGPGIAAEKLAHLFERYYRAGHHETHYNGLGLGLYICAEIIKKHNGQIGVNSELGKGSTFWFSLPLLKAG